ncbi:NUDIX hydrolase [Pelagibius sp.]|uniref:NUDIX hydrolase n=1 Tax=Pelagibius sp. TaxID=1931238 RepID=UPI0026142CBA|nr:NUDIX hydrolase [Pelagibius sp.]
MNDYPNRPLIGVGVVVFKADRVLLIRRGKPPREGQWSLPGGRQRLGERIEAAARREVREEAGIEIAVGPLVDVVDSITRDDNGAVQYHYTLVDLLAEWRGGEAAAGHDAAEVAWADPADLAPFDLWTETERIIALAVQKRGAA